jgi:hypothetical protein
MFVTETVIFEAVSVDRHEGHFFSRVPRRLRQPPCPKLFVTGFCGNRDAKMRDAVKPVGVRSCLARESDRARAPVHEETRNGRKI